MKKIAILAGGLLVLMAGAAFAAGLDLNWDNCITGGSVSDKTVNCATSTTDIHLMGSFMPGQAFSMTSTNNFLDYQVDASTLPAFWGGTVFTSRFIGAASSGGAVVPGCLDWTTLDLAGAGDNLLKQVVAPNRVRLTLGYFIDALAGGSQAATDNVSAFNLTVKMADAATTAGCPTPACFVFNRAFVEDALNGLQLELTTADVRQHVTWQGGGSILCPQATPTQKKTWGAIKALYR